MLIIMCWVKFLVGYCLFKYGCKCENFYGYNYIVEFYVSGRDVDDVGWLIDFVEFKKFFKGWIDDNWDYGFIVY